MKKLFFSTIMFMCLQTLSAQNNSISSAPYSGRLNPLTNSGSLITITGNDPSGDYDMYMRRTRTMRITGLSLLGAGVVTGGIALLVATNNDDYVDYDTELRRERTTTTLFVISAVTGIASIPFMVLAHANKNKARAALSNEKAYIPGKHIYITGVTLSLPIGK